MSKFIALSANTVKDSSLEPMIGDHEIQYIDQRIIQVIHSYGFTPLIITRPEDLVGMVDHIYGIILPGSELNSNKESLVNFIDADQSYKEDVIKDKIDKALVTLSIQNETPLFAICRGLQSLNIALGGNLRLIEKESFHRKKKGETRQDLNHMAYCKTPNSIIHKCFKEQMQVNGTHDIQIEKLARPLTATLIAKDGVIEAAEIINHKYFLGVQFHPELRIDIDPNYKSLFDLFFESCNQ